jgi:hypothetical protein
VADAKFHFILSIPAEKARSSSVQGNRMKSSCCRRVVVASKAQEGQEAVSVAGRVDDPHATLILVEADIQRPVQRILRPPAIADQGG